ncbi:response regulator transcription factor [Nocardioides anomalus]|uniref:Response regulator transcription factor n=1 Tax=Nocardioides anomalus TaxID=2712223 RepID=A0A6G6W8E0_9ACTN|nr:response regulator transcription factor [Nocardioides anomalus]QIG41486.1 response regulator transcription factor [Nocardioides anomalus]
MIPVLPHSLPDDVPAFWNRSTTSAVLIDDAPDIRWLVRRALERTGDFVVLGEAGDGQSGVELVMDHAPDVVLLDLDMPGMGGLEALGLIRAHQPAAQVVMLTGVTSSAQLDAALDAGALGVIRKGSSLSGILAQLRQLLDPRPGLEIALEGVV